MSVDELTKRHLIQNYLKPTRTPLLCMVGGAASLLLWLLLSPEGDLLREGDFTLAFNLVTSRWSLDLETALLWTVLPLAGVALLSGGTYRQIWKRLELPTDQQMDEWLAEDFARTVQFSIQATGMEQSDLIAEPVLIFGPRTSQRGGAAEGMRRGNDDKIRYTPIDLAVLQYTPHQLITFRCSLDLLTGRALEPEVQEFFYRDIVSMSVRTESGTLKLLKRLTLLRLLAWAAMVLLLFIVMLLVLLGIATGGVGMRGRAIWIGAIALLGAWFIWPYLRGLRHYVETSFELATSGTPSFKVTLNDSRVTSTVSGESPTQLADRAVAAVRKMLREKKSDEAP